MDGAGGRIIAKMVVVFDAQHVYERDRRRATMALYEAALRRAVILAGPNQLAQSWVCIYYRQRSTSSTVTYLAQVSNKLCAINTHSSGH